MTNVQSKLSGKVFCTCKDFQHPWTNSCVNATAGILLSSTPYCLRVYTIVYALSLIMRHRMPKLSDLKKTLLGIIQSSAFLVTNAYTFILYNCLLRNIFGCYYWSTIAFIPCFLASWSAIIVERPARRPLLALYVSNVATESLWRMAESRGYVRSITHGQTLIFGVSISILLYLFRLGLHKTNCKDSLFDILRIFVGKTEEGPLKSLEELNKNIENGNENENENRSARPRVNLTTISGLVQIYLNFINSLKKRHPSCPHKENCLKYSIMGCLKPFVGGVSLQVALKLLLNVKELVKFRMKWRKTIFNTTTLKLGFFMGGFSLLYKSISCILRHSFGRDDPRFALPAGLIASVSFMQYPDITVALYVMWKMLQNIYNLGYEKNLVPKVPGFLFFLYSFATSVLFHAAICEPKALRPSYFKFLQAISGGRLTRFNVAPFDAYGVEMSKNLSEVIEKLKVAHTTPLPKWAMSS